LAGTQRRAEIGRYRRGDVEPSRDAQDALLSRLVGDLDGDRVDRFGECVAYSDGPAELVVEIGWFPSADIEWPVDEDLFGSDAGLQPGLIDDRLEGRTRLATRLDGAIELALRIIAPAHHGAHRAVRRHDDDRALAGVRLRAAAVQCALQLR